MLLTRKPRTECLVVLSLRVKSMICTCVLLAMYVKHPRAVGNLRKVVLQLQVLPRLSLARSVGV